MQRAQVRDGDDVGQPGGQAALDVDDVAHRGRAVDRAAERHAVADGSGEAVDQHVAAALGADQVGVAEPNDVDVLISKSLLCCGETLQVVLHGLLLTWV